ncbi:MAG: DNA mismatch repair protein MutS [Deltaproteobacteria bacterium]|jgi:DNA mismatch repair protein MutS|nr:DNA mismatch repair protein MutS [Deltaproteobacteria bacterium]
MAKQPTSNDVLTPMLRQYMQIKDQYPDSILFFRLGDFYEMFYDDAKIASHILDITLTSRNKNSANPVPLCGIPYHSVEPYIAKLLESGKKIAICDQIEDPKFSKGIVKRDVTRVITPGVVADGLGLNSSSDNFLVGLVVDENRWGIAICDISTGLFQATEFDSTEVLFEELLRIGAKELLIDSGLTDGSGLSLLLKEKLPKTLISRYPFKLNSEEINLDGLDTGEKFAERYPMAARAASYTLSYLRETQKSSLGQITSIQPYEIASVMRLDESTMRNLELTKTLLEGDREGSLLSTIDRTSTAVGARKLRRWLLYPLRTPSKIDERLDAVERIMTEPEFLRSMPQIMTEIYDLERITGRVGAGAANARDLIALKGSLEAVMELKSLIKGTDGLLGNLQKSIDTCENLVAEIGSMIVDEPPFSLRDGGLIKGGVSQELDELLEIVSGGKSYIAKLESKEKRETGINSLKVRFNKVFGYYLEVTHAHRDKVPNYYIRKQTLTNAERYITPELKEYEEKVLGAEEKVKALEYEIFSQLREEVAKAIPKLQRTADAVASIDVLLSFARLAAESDYCRPTVDDSSVIDIKEGRHPIIERLNPLDRFIPNDAYMDADESRFMMITGPNMAGKSTVMRQTALVVLMAQIGSFVPATNARIGTVDRIFTRVGASDALSKGQSTFMVEMAEASTILRDATQKSLIIIDEIGRGTSTFDGLAIAWAVAEDIHDRIQSRTMFATHYHELTELALTKSGIRNMQIAVKEWSDNIVFLRKLVPGGTSRSYGIQVAKLAGLPEAVIERAGEVLGNLESSEFDEVGRPRLATHHTDEQSEDAPAQFQLFTKAVPSEVVSKLEAVDTASITPLEALNILHELKVKILS